MADVTIKPTDNGPYEVKGTLVLLGGDGNPYSLAGERDSDDEAIYLCRCGHSNNKPFCDGTHRKVGFESEVRAAADM
jgi:CDGSH-type Zn-finger protein